MNDHAKWIPRCRPTCMTAGPYHAFDCPNHPGTNMETPADTIARLNQQVSDYAAMIRSRNMTIESLGRAIHDATGTPIGDGENHELAMERLDARAAIRDELTTTNEETT